MVFGREGATSRHAEQSLSRHALKILIDQSRPLKSCVDQLRHSEVRRRSKQQLALRLPAEEMKGTGRQQVSSKTGSDSLQRINGVERNMLTARRHEVPPLRQPRHRLGNSAGGDQHIVRKGHQARQIRNWIHQVLQHFKGRRKIEPRPFLPFETACVIVRGVQVVP